MKTREKIIAYYKECEANGHKPTVREIQKTLRLSSTSVVQYHLGKSGYKFQSMRSDSNRNKIIEILGCRCAICGFSDKRALQIDHVHGGGMAQRKSLGQREMYRRILVELQDGNFSNYQLLCANCNWIKRHNNKELVRHKPIEII